MEIIFGIRLDGAEWSQEEASLGKLHLGPTGLLGVLETQLGLNGLTTHPAQRINEYMRRLKSCDDDRAWFHNSLTADAWSTAKQMLSWRDELTGAGWNGLAADVSSPRLQALADVESLTDIAPLSSGREDRLRTVVRALQHHNKCGIISIHTLEPSELLPPVWKRVLSLLEASGVSIGQVDNEVEYTGSGNLSHVKRVFAGQNCEVPLTADDETLVLLKAADEWEAAEHLATWLAAKRDSNEQVTIICGSRSNVLDQALAHQGLPALGSTVDSKWRSVLQVLPLVLVNAWKPVDIKLLVELLTLPVSPVPRFAARHLLSAIHKEPGTGGDAWNEALSNIAAERGEIAEKESKRWVEHEEFIKKLDKMLASNRFDPEAGIPEEELIRRCQWVTETLAPRVEASPMFIEAMSHAREMQRLAKGTGLLSRVTVERMLDSVIATGSTTPGSCQQAATWRVVNHPQEITWKCGTVIWWGFYDDGPSSATYWSHGERSYLQSQGVEIEPTETLRLREADSWRQSIRQAQNSLILITPEQINGEAVYPHPFWDEVRYAAVKSGDEQETSRHLIRHCEKLTKDDGLWQLAGRSTRLTRVAPITQAVGPAVHKLPKQVVTPPQRLSYSQMGTMIGCPMKWALHYHARLRVPGSMAVPTGNLMIGKLTHHIIEELYAEPAQEWNANAAADKALELYDELVCSRASELLLAGRELDNLRYRKKVVRAVRLLVEAIKQGKLSVIRSEHPLEGVFHGDGVAIPFVGYADLLLKNEEGQFFVLDMKWSNSSNYYKKAIEESTALQLATYAWLLRADNNNAWPESGYFMLAQGELLSDSAIFGEGALRSERSSLETWEMGTKTWEEKLLEVQSGRLEASGISEQEIKASGVRKDKVEKLKKEECEKKNLLYQRPQCGFCDFGALCGLTGGAS